MHHFITGAAGFIGSQLVDSLLAAGEQVSGADDFSLGRPEFLQSARRNPAFRFFESDVSITKEIVAAVRAASEEAGPPAIIWHLAANSDISAGVEDVSIDFRRTIQTTIGVLEAAKSEGIGKIVFASTSAVYGERGNEMLTEDSGPLLPISSYGAAKLGSEAFLSAAAESFVERLWIFRFANVVGPRLTHGAIFDFIARLATHPSALQVLGDGSQTKQYIHVSELIDAMKFVVAGATGRRNVFNIAPTGEGTRVAFLAEHVVDRFLPGTAIAYSGGGRGWVGDIPYFRLSIERIAQLGWQPTLSSDEAVVRAIDELVRNFEPAVREQCHSTP
jgi:UDP-glucose 4-epimerase